MRIFIDIVVVLGLCWFKDDLPDISALVLNWFDDVPAATALVQSVEKAVDEAVEKAEIVVAVSEEAPVAGAGPKAEPESEVMAFTQPEPSQAEVAAVPIVTRPKDQPLGQQICHQSSKQERLRCLMDFKTAAINKIHRRLGQ